MFPFWTSYKVWHHILFPFVTSCWEIKHLTARLYDSPEPAEQLPLYMALVQSRPLQQLWPYEALVSLDELLVCMALVWPNSLRAACESRSSIQLWLHMTLVWQISCIQLCCNFIHIWLWSNWTNRGCIWLWCSAVSVLVNKFNLIQRKHVDRLSDGN